MGAPLFTIGHGSLPFSDLLNRLEAHGVRTVLDVRSQPYSRHAPHYGKSELEAELVASGLAYRWLGHHLGGRPLTDGTAAPIDDPAVLEAGITEAAGLARGAITALLCAELDPTYCHRGRDLAPAFEADGFLVSHILADGSSHPHQQSFEI